jgi:hypothetical protein
MPIYSFTVKGTHSDGYMVEMRGRLQAGDGYPLNAFDKAVAVCQKTSPRLLVDRSKPGHVTLRKLKAKSL